MANSTTKLVEYFLSIEPDQLDSYLKYFDKSMLIVSDNKTAIEAINNAAIQIDFDVLVVVSDDFSSFKGWDNEILNATQNHRNFVLKTFDGDQPWIVTLPIMDHLFYKSYGYVYYPGYKHLFADTDLTTVAQYTGKLVFRNDILFKQEFIEDSGHKNTNNTWEQGEKLYLERYKNDFGVIKQHEISHKPHLDWVKHRLR